MIYRRFIDVWFAVVLSTFGLSSPFLQRDNVRYLITTFYPYEDDSNIQDIFYQSKISNYGRHYFIKFVGFLPIYYAINMYIISSYMIFS